MITDTRGILCVLRDHLHLHSKKFGENQVFTYGGQLLLALRKMNFPQRIRMSFATQFRRQLNIEGTLLHMFEQMED